MASTFEKLNLRQPGRIAVLNAPASFDQEIEPLRDVEVLRSLRGLENIEFVIVFVTKQEEADAFGKEIGGKAKGDSIVWFAWPKGTSKKYKSEIGRDNGWAVLGKLGFERVRSVSIDEDWSALRFRRVEFIKKMTRSPAGRLSADGKARQPQIASKAR